MVFGLVVTRKDTRLTSGHGGRIRCPTCAWEPSRGDRWHCHETCGHVWNTFETRGRCPECGKQWAETACLRCGVWSRHEDWYVSN